MIQHRTARSASSPSSLRSFAGDGQIRTALLQALAADTAVDARIVEEMWLAPTQERADVAVVGRSLLGYEIKSNRDDLSRLPRQIAAYDRVFDESILVVGERYLSHAAGMLPNWWGVYVAEGDGCGSVHLIRSPGSNPNVDRDALVRLLWRSELESALLVLGFDRFDRSTRGELRTTLLSVTDGDLLRRTVREALRTRVMSDARIATRQLASATAAS